jgi:hypothetical protein
MYALKKEAVFSTKTFVYTNLHAMTYQDRIWYSVVE